MRTITQFWLALAVVLCFSTVGASAQSFQLSNITSPKLKSGEYHAQLYITNTTSVEKNLKVKAYTNEIKPDDISYFCVGINCYPPAVTEVTYLISPNTTDSLIAYFTAVPAEGTRSVRYEFSDADNPSDKVEHTFVFGIGTSVNEVSTNTSGALSLAAPAPANQTATIQYSVPENSTAAIELYSADSRLLKTFPISRANSSLVIPTGEFASGSYFYTLVIEGKTVATNKLIITR